MTAPVDTFEYVEMYEAGRSPSGKTAVFTVCNRHHGDELGTVAWYGPWHQYTFRPAAGVVFSPGCLRDVATFVEEQTGTQRRGRLKPWRKT